MAAMRGGPRMAVGSAAWIEEERSSALKIEASDVEEFSFSARNEMEWLNEHMAEIFSENQMNVAELFKTPGKLRGRTPRTAKKANLGEVRVPLSNIFSSTPKGAPNPFALPNLNQAQKSKIKIAEDRTEASTSRAPSPQKAPTAPSQTQQQQASLPVSVVDSGYHGSQSQDTVDLDAMPIDGPSKPPAATDDTVQAIDFGASPTRTAALLHAQASPTRASIEETFQSAKEEQTRHVTANLTSKQVPQQPEANQQPEITSVTQKSPTRIAQSSSPAKTSPIKRKPVNSSPVKSPTPQQTAPPSEDIDPTVDDIRSPSDGSSPIRPLVRKPSLNFAALPAREPLTSNKSLGPRISRISHLDQTRTSYYHRQTGGKSIGANTGLDTRDDGNEDDHDDMDIDDDHTIRKEQVDAKVAIAAHNKTYTQRLQDQISMLGKSQANGPRPSKSLANLHPVQQPAVSQQPQLSQQSHTRPVQEPPKPSSPAKQKLSVPAPGAFPEDDDDDWIEPPPTQAAAARASPRPGLPKSHSTDVMEGVHGKDTVSGSEFVLPKSRPTSPKKMAPTIPERTTSTSAFSHSKSASVPSFPTMDNVRASESATPKKPISVSNPTLNTVNEDGTPGSPPKSPSRSLRDSPLKQVKNKLSSILKSSKGLLASSAALSAEGKSYLTSPSMTRLGFHPGPSTESLRSIKPSNETLYPELPQQRSATPVMSPAKGNARRTRASVEREKREQKEKEKEAKEREKEAKEAKRMAERMDKLEKEREKEREKARVFSKEQERVAEMEKQIQHKAPPQVEAATPAPPTSPPKATRTSPRKTKAMKEAEEMNDVDMADASSAMPPPQISRIAATPASARGQALKRPLKPTKEVVSKVKQERTVIRVNTTSAQQSQFHPSQSFSSSNMQESYVPPPQRQLTSKASHASLQAKPSLQSLKSSAGSSGRPKALELAAKRKEQEEREAQRKREAKMEMERKRAAIQEEERRQEQQRRLEMERAREEERRAAEKAAQAKKDAQRQAAIEKAKQTRAPPPAVRNGPSEYSNMADKGPSRPPSRLGSMMPQESGRPVNAMLSNASKMASKRALQQEANEEHARPPMQRNGPSYQAKEAKRMRMSEEFDDDIDMADSQPGIIKGPPVRPSGGFKKELPPKSMFANGYGNAHQGVSRDLFKSMVGSQHGGASKAGHPLDTAQFSKGTIPFAPNPNPAGPSAASTHKTPARPAGAAGAKSAAKSAAKSSPFGKQGDNISLPDIQTDDEDEDDDYEDNRGGGGKMQVASWTNSPDLRRLLVGQETVDPMQIFGPPAPLVMEEVFSKSKERFHKFRARTSSANWSGSDRLTEEDIRKDLQARDRMRREGGWSYELARDGLA